MVVDTGDRVEGSGLYDGSDPPGRYYFDILGEQHIDFLSTGNHELYQKNTSDNEYSIVVPKFRDNYIASNLDVLDPKTKEIVPMAPRFRRFTTKKQGIRIMAFGFIFDFTRNSENSIIQPVEKAIQEDWFQEAIRSKDIDLILIIGHAAIRSQEFDAVFKAIRKVKWDVPIQFFGGHYHVRDYKKFDSKAFGLASGRFMETIGFQSISGVSTGKQDALRAQASPKFARRYIDNNLYSFYHHTGLDKKLFPTEHGANVSKQINEARDKLRLDSTFGCATKDLWMSRAKYPSNSSIFSWIEERVLPDVILQKDRINITRVAMINTGGVRFDILKGPFTRDSTYIVSPFTSGFRYIPSIPYEKAIKILPILNSAGPILQGADPKLDFSRLAPPEQNHYKTSIFLEQQQLQPFNSDRSGSQRPLSVSSDADLTPGYTTKDDAGSTGDDTIHSPITFHQVPNVIQSIIKSPNETGDPETVDLVFLDFIQPYVLMALKFVGLDFADADTEAYMEGENFTSLLAKWVGDNWKENC